MALKSHTRSFEWKVLHFLVRFLGLNGLVAVAVGFLLWQGLGYEFAGLIVVIAGASAVVLALLAEVQTLVRGVASHRGAAGVNVLVQVALAATLLIGANVYSFANFKRYDCTSDKTFTLDETLRTKLAQLRGSTDIIIYVQHVSFGQRVDLRQDEYDQAAEKIIIKKVEDLAEQFQELGASFRVHILDTQKKTYKEREQRLSALSDDKDHVEAIKAAIKKAPENSIFFYSRDTKNLQRLSFNDIYHLDKKKSEEASEGKGNLVLIDQGVQTFAEKVFKIEEKKPRIGFAVIHGVLGQDGTEEIGMPGLKKALQTRGFEGRDIVLRKWPQRDPAALEHDENRYEILEAQKAHLERALKESEEELADIEKARKFWETKKLDEIDKELVLVQTIRGLQPISRKQLEAIRKAQGRIPLTVAINETYRAGALKELGESVDETKAEIASIQKKLDKARTDQGKLSVDNLAEQRRISDVRVKFNRLLADVDLLVLPRATIFNLVRGDRIPSRVYPLEDAHMEALKDFMKAGKPVLFCLGPMNEPGDESGEDAVEKLLSSFNVQLPNQAILYNSEGDALAESDERDQLPGGATVEIPPVEFEWKIPAGSRTLGMFDLKASQPIRTSMRLTADSLGDKVRGDLRLRSPRPVYVVRTTWPADALASTIGSLSLGWPSGPSQALVGLYTKTNKKFDESAVILMSAAESWNEDKPFRTEKYTPRFERPKVDDPNKGTVQEKRRGPFPIGVALEAEVPAEWYEKDATKKPTTVRLAVIGQGGLFIGEKLSPMREKLFLDVSNWLLGRDNLLAKESETWQYPRVTLDSDEKKLWEWGARLGLPLLFVYLGMIVWLVRRMR